MCLKILPGVHKKYFLSLFGQLSHKVLVITFLLCARVVKDFSCQEQFPPMSFAPDFSIGQPVAEGTPSIFLCKANSVPVSEYRWIKDGQYFTNFSSNFYSYRKDNISRSDAGIYGCEASNSLGSILSSQGELRVAYMSQFNGSNQTVNLNANISDYVIVPMTNIDCYPKPVLTWKQNSVPMSEESIGHQITLNGSLVLLDRNQSDSGFSYQVEILNSVVMKVFNGPRYYVNITGQLVNTTPKLVVGPVDIIVSEIKNENGVFECIVNARPISSLQIKWYRILNNGTKVLLTQNNEKYVISAMGQRRIIIKSPKLADAGIYQCVASLPSSSDIIANASLIVYVSPTFGNQFQSMVMPDFGQNITINCVGHGVPLPTVRWYFNSLELGQDYNSSSYILQSNGSLTISHLGLEHAGMYQCFLRNVAGETFTAMWLKVNSSPPMMVTPPSNTTVLEDNSTSLYCETKGAPKPVVYWSRVTTNGKVENISAGGRMQILERGDLLIGSTVPADSGIYTCISINSQGNVSASATLSVFVRTQIVLPPQDLRLIKGSTATLPCGVSHDPSVNVTWKWKRKGLNSQIEQDMVPEPPISISDDGTLTIPGIKNDDIGNYTCLVTSPAGNDSFKVSLTVIELAWPPKILSVDLHPTDVRSVIVRWTPDYNGNTPILRFSVQYKEVIAPITGDITETTWITSSGGDIPSTNTQSIVSGLKPAKSYQFRVFASNEVGESQPSQAMPNPPLVMPQQPPSSPPKGFFGLSASNTSVTLGWQPPNEDDLNGPLLGYTIQYKITGYQNNTFQRVNVSSISSNPRYELKRLAYFEQYDIQIAAFNAEGVGVYSGIINVFTLEGHPTASPENLQLAAVNSTVINASWTPPNQQFINGINLGYKVLYHPLNVQTEYVAVVPQDPMNPTGTQSTLLYNLLKYTQYNVTVLCYTRQGDGPKTTNRIVQTQEDVPSQVGSIIFSEIRDTSLKVNWTAPSEVNGILLGYTLMYEKKNLTSTRQTVNLTDATLSYSIYQLTPTTKYTIYVTASTIKGSGPAKSADIESGVPPELPSAPVNLGVSNIQARSVLLQFQPGFDGKTSITLWIVEALVGQLATEYSVIYQISDPNARSIQVQKLHPYTLYRLRLTAENIVGHSPASEPTRQFQTLQDAPEIPPRNVTVRALNATSLRVSWTPLLKDDWNGDPRGYKIYYKSKMEAKNYTVKLDYGMNMDSTILGGLQEWMEYEVKTLAYNDVGQSAYSDVVVERTREAVPSSGPSNVQAKAILSTSINVSWGEVPFLDQNGQILGYKVKFWFNDVASMSQTLDVPGNDTFSTVLVNLRKYVLYNVQVLAYTRMGDGIPSSPDVTERTLPDVPGPPVIIWFPYVTYTQATIVWEEPLEPNGIITGYMVSYKLRDSSEEYKNSTVLQPSMKNYTVSYLQKQAYYEFTVIARTLQGWGKTADVEVFTMMNRSPPDSPSKPTIKSSLIQARSVTISWIPAPFNGYGPLRNFTVQYMSSPPTWMTVPEAVMPADTTYSVNGLRPNTRYVFRVAATNDIGTSAFSIQSDEVTTLGDLPEGAPRFVMVVPLDTMSVKVSWEQPLPSTWNGDLIGYVLMYKQQGSNYMEETVTAPSMSCELHNLIKFVNYEFLVKAFNSVGQGPTSPPVTVYVGEAAPSAAPINIHTKPVNSTQILVTWDPPPVDTQNGDLSGYKISYWPNASSESTSKQIISRERAIILTDLQMYSDYAFTIQAYNLAGEGPKSAVYYEKTLEGLPGPPANITFWNVTYTSLDVTWLPPLKPNGKIVSYEVSYLEGGSKLVKFNMSGSSSSLSITELMEKTPYAFSASAFTSVGQGNKTEKKIVTEPQPGSPGAPEDITFVLQANLQKMTLRWIHGASGDPHMTIYGHIIQAKLNDSSVWNTIAQVGSETQAEISLVMFKPDKNYNIRVTALNGIGAGEYGYADKTVQTTAPPVYAVAEVLSFHYQWWFLVIVALTSLIIILIVISLLCLVSRRNKKKQPKGDIASSTSNLAATTEPEDGGFSNIEMIRQSTTHSRRNKFASIRSTSARSPPRPSPASVVYSDDDDQASASKPPLPDEDDDESSCTEKPSELGDSSEASDEASDDDSFIDEPLPPPPPSSPPPPPFTVINNRIPIYKDSNLHSHNNSSFYQYTDSEAESNQYAYSLNGGQVVLNNTAGSRAPLPGFSSFV